MQILKFIDILAENKANKIFSEFKDFQSMLKIDCVRSDEIYVKNHIKFIQDRINHQLIMMGHKVVQFIQHHGVV